VQATPRAHARQPSETEVGTMVARMTLDQLARYLHVDRLDAKNALNRIGICAPSGEDEAILITPGDLKRISQNLATHQRGWEAPAEGSSDRSIV
jgi:hypothetical protein